MSRSISPISRCRRESQIRQPNRPSAAVRTAAYQAVNRKRIERLFMISRLPHHVTGAANRMDQLRLAMIDLHPQQPHEDLQRVLGDFAAESPYRLDNGVAADYASGISHQQFEQPV